MLLFVEISNQLLTLGFLPAAGRYGCELSKLREVLLILKNIAASATNEEENKSVSTVHYFSIEIPGSCSAPYIEPDIFVSMEYMFIGQGRKPVSSICCTASTCRWRNPAKCSYISWRTWNDKRGFHRIFSDYL